MQTNPESPQQVDPKLAALKRLIDARAQAAHGYVNRHSRRAAIARAKKEIKRGGRR